MSRAFKSHRHAALSNSFPPDGVALLLSSGALKTEPRQRRTGTLPRRLIWFALALLLCHGLGYCTKARASEGFTAGLHLATAHFGNQLESVTLGVYGRVDQGPLQGLTGGVYRNSYDRTSAYLGWTFETPERWFAITAGAVTGYPAARLMPLLSPSLRIPLWRELAARLAYIPKPLRSGTAHGVHAMLEMSF